ncbi:uncharacterized protein J3D65DRAFT_353332 [Phyllosticta citribraziliensis]|uniref:Transmembrane protein n=1 Tax=Phyllosticta citribraziliensis TaxID=989973 RepID=A0ABR1LPS9_9PEZI
MDFPHPPLSVCPSTCLPLSLSLLLTVSFWLSHSVIYLFPPRIRRFPAACLVACCVLHVALCCIVAADGLLASSSFVLPAFCRPRRFSPSSRLRCLEQQSQSAGSWISALIEVWTVKRKLAWETERFKASFRTPPTTWASRLRRPSCTWQAAAAFSSPPAMVAWGVSRFAALLLQTSCPRHWSLSFTLSAATLPPPTQDDVQLSQVQLPGQRGPTAHPADPKSTTRPIYLSEHRCYCERPLQEEQSSVGQMWRSRCLFVQLRSR